MTDAPKALSRTKHALNCPCIRGRHDTEGPLLMCLQHQCSCDASKASNAECFDVRCGHSCPQLLAIIDAKDAEIARLREALEERDRQWVLVPTEWRQQVRARIAKADGWVREMPL